MSFYRRNLPHWQPSEAEYFVTFRLDGSLPAEAIKRLKFEQKTLKNTGAKQSQIERETFAKYERLLDNPSGGVTWLKNKDIAQVVADALHYRNPHEYDLYAYCIMPNHVHVVFRLTEDNESEVQDRFPVTKLLQKLKRYTAIECNKILERKGQFWLHESFDRVIRDKNELENTIKYVINNPVKAGLTNSWQNWPYNYCKPEFMNTFGQNL